MDSNQYLDRTKKLYTDICRKNTPKGYLAPDNRIVICKLDAIESVLVEAFGMSVNDIQELKNH